MMANFYGFYNTYGVRTRNFNNERVGYVLVFRFRAVRDEWVNADVLYNGSYHRESITANEARREMIRATYDDLLNKHIVGERADLKYLPMDTLVEEYSNYEHDCAVIYQVVI
jgi:hypothetical protein